MEHSMITQVADAKTLTGSAVAATTVHKSGGYGQHTLYVQYDPDTDSTNAMQVTIEISPDYDEVSAAGTWFPFTGEYSAGTGTITEGAQITISYPSDGTDAQNEPPFTFYCDAMAIRIKALETNTPGDFGAYTAWIISAHG